MHIVRGTDDNETELEYLNQSFEAELSVFRRNRIPFPYNRESFPHNKYWRCARQSHRGQARLPTLTFHIRWLSMIVTALCSNIIFFRFIAVFCEFEWDDDLGYFRLESGEAMAIRVDTMASLLSEVESWQERLDTDQISLFGQGLRWIFVLLGGWTEQGMPDGAVLVILEILKRQQVLDLPEAQSVKLTQLGPSGEKVCCLTTSQLSEWCGRRAV